MGLYKKCLLSSPRRWARQTPAKWRQLDMFDDLLREDIIYVRTQEEGTQDVQAKQSSSVQSSRSMDSSNERSQ